MNYTTLFLTPISIFIIAPNLYLLSSSFFRDFFFVSSMSTHRISQRQICDYSLLWLKRALSMASVTRERSNNSVEMDETPLAGPLFLLFYFFIFVLGLLGKNHPVTWSSLNFSFDTCHLGNSIVIYVAIRKKNYRNVTNCYIISLAIADLFFLGFSIPYTTFLALTNTDPFGKIFNKIYTYMAYVSWLI